MAAQDVKPVSKADLKSIEVKHFTNAEGVQLSPNFSKYFYSSFLAEMQRLNLAEQSVEDGAPVNDTQGSHGVFSRFVVLEGKFILIQEGHRNGDKFDAGFANLEIRYFRRSNHKALPFAGTPGTHCLEYGGCTTPLLKLKVTLNGSLQDDEQKVAEAAGVQLADAMRMTWYPEKTSKTDKMGWIDLLGW
jgi:hypothetical protein